MKKFFEEFKTFAMRGNVIDMAVGVVIGGAFKGIIDSMVNDIISPILGIFLNNDLSQNILIIGAVEIKYGSFLTAVINFLLMAFVIFVMVKIINKIREAGKSKEAVTPTALSTQKCRFCKTVIDIEATRCPHCTSILE